MKVNMTPNPLDVVTIHASQGDTEARQWEFELHNNGELIDTSDVTEQMFFKAYKGGTEQILPENGSTPTTSPFKGDIKYPQGLLTDQEFLYRESPTEEDGLAKITDVKGNTLVWNQLIQNGNFANTSVWQNYNSTFTVSGNTATVKTTNASTQFGIYQPITFKANHKYFISFEAKKHGTITLKRNRLSSGQEQVQEGLYRTIETASSDYSTTSPIRIIFSEPVSDITNDYFMVKNYMIVDLTKMGLDSITSVDEFTSLFPLPYYAYNQGTLLSFNGNGIKTVGFNQWDEEWEVGAITAQGQPSITADRIRSKNFIPVMPNTTYYRKSPNNIQPFFYDANQQFIEYGFWNTGAFPTPSNCAYMKFQVDPVYGLTYNNDICINISSSRNGEYEPYKESSLSLPISQYFPNGMKSAGSVYDELTESKAITRIGAVDMGTLSWSYVSANRRFVAIISDAKSSSSLTVLENIVSAKYENATWENILTNAKDKIISLHYTSNNSYVAVIDNDYTDAPTFKSAMNGVYLYFELATESETSFSTASLVTENAEIPLSNEDGVLIGKCTEQLSSESGFFDAKIKLAEADGECYSNKLQLHVERKPS